MLGRYSLRFVAFSTAIVVMSVLSVGTAKAGGGSYFAAFGAGVNVAPDYEGSDDYETKPLPLVSLGWKSDPVVPEGGTGLQLGLHDIALSFPKGLDAGLAKLYRPEGVYRASLGVSYEQGRDQDDNVALNGLGDIDAHAAVKAGLNFEAEDSGWEFELVWARALSSNDYGSTIDGKVGYGFALSDSVKFTPSVHLTWADQDHMQTYFGITQAQANASGYTAYDAGSGLKSSGLGAKLDWSISKQWLLSTDLTLTELSADAADSPLVKDRGRSSQVGLTAFLMYRF